MNNFLHKRLVKVEQSAVTTKGGGGGRACTPRNILNLEALNFQLGIEKSVVYDNFY